MKDQLGHDGGRTAPMEQDGRKTAPFSNLRWQVLLAVAASLLPPGFLYLYKGQECGSMLPEDIVDNYEMLPWRQTYASWVPWPQRKDYDGVKGDVPRILVWFKSPVVEWVNNFEERYEGCTRPCYVTYNRQQLHRSDAVVMYIQKIGGSPFPPGRRAFQKWVFWTMESPKDSIQDRLKKVNTAFNWTMTYRRDSDITNAFGRVVRRSESLPSSLHVGKLEKRWRSKSRMVAWFPTSCDGAAAKYVEELKKHVFVDVYGECGNMSCRTTSYGDDEECYEMLANKYFFVLVFERDLCVDYVTMPLYRFLRYKVVPVVKGAANYSMVAPPGSVVNVDEYAEPYNVAAFMMKAASDFEVYSQYLSWKRDYEVVMHNYDDFCGLCNKLYGEEFVQESVYKNISDWWNNGTKCTD
ncbi:alpha-(1,3)-fucosyltransferase C-like [Dermacentor albipictus]|uniref:alpha-(1,3)-fucosyltransferase C-like n=1 Tax=Dermacentor albipictus TaxID=60249 RepID=UPI0038FC763A